MTYCRATPGHGRYFAKRGLSLQAMAREIRNAIAYPFYDDLDFHNCHPTLLLLHCQIKGVPCPRLEDYCQRRDGVMAELDPSVGHPAAKAAVLAMINGGMANLRVEIWTPFRRSARSGLHPSQTKCGLCARSW